MGYNKSKLYILKNTKNNDYYIGITCQSLQRRFNNHLYISFSYTNNDKLYMSMRRIGEENYYIEKIKDIECSNRQELEHERAAYIRDLINNTPKEEFRRCLNMKLYGSEPRDI